MYQFAIWYTRTIILNLWDHPNPVNITLREQTVSHLQVPYVFTFFGDSFARVAHQGNEHVEQEDVGQNYVQDEEDVENLLILHVISELQISHSDGELEQLQDCKSDVVVTRLLALKRLVTKAPPTWRWAIGQFFRSWSRVVYESNDGYGRGEHLDQTT